MATKRKLLIGTFNFGGRVDQSVHDYMIDLVRETDLHPSFGHKNVWHFNIDTTPVDMARNRMVCNAEAHEVDFLMMIDSDMKPDLYIGRDGEASPGHPNAKKFFTSTIDWMMARNEPTIVAAPYCGPPPVENVFVFQWGNRASECPGPNFSIDQYSREQAATMTGIQPCCALPTGVILIDMRVFRNWPHPRFYYEFTDKRCIEKASTEDVTFSRDAFALGYQCYCNWDAWAGHNKHKCVGKPQFVKPDDDVLDEIKKGMNFFRRLREIEEAKSSNGETVADHARTQATDNLASTLSARAAPQPARG